MATVVSHAMRRYPITPPDAEYSSYGFRSSVPGQSWSQEEPESSLSRSMRYAEPWLYGSVRAPSGLVLTPALVLCSCPDYLNGTKRSSKKGHTTCKKCKGTRIPLNNVDSKFGTVRCYPTSPVVPTSCIRAGTLRAPSSKSRPSILGNGNDPYDLMRRSRLSVSEGTSQFRARSVSPNKNKISGGSRSKSTTPKAKYSTVGRKSILECDVNPYELMGLDQQPTDASITLVNGQRIRVKPKIPESDYEDVQVRKVSNQVSNQVPKQVYNQISNQVYNQKQGSEVKVQSNGLGPPKSNEKETDYCSNRFKSILKKPTPTFSDTDGRSEDLPLPAKPVASTPAPLTPRKKVQFLVESEHPEVFYENDTINPSSSGYESNTSTSSRESSIENDKSDTDDSKTNSCRLRRSKSERVPQESTKVLFLDTMALRTKPNHSDAREVFTTKDLEKLDGVNIAKLKNFENIRPRGPPPLPPPPQHPPPDVPTKKMQSEEITPVTEPKIDLNQTRDEGNDAMIREKLEQAKRMEELKKFEMEEGRKLEEVKKLEEVRKLEEAKALEEAKQQARRLEEAIRVEEATRIAVEKTKEEDRKRAEETRRKEELIREAERLKLEEETRRKEELIREAERLKLDEEKRKIEEARRLIEEERRMFEEEKRLNEKRQKELSDRLILPVTIQKNLDDLDKLINLETPPGNPSPPSAPPRKRSNNKQPATISYQTVRVESQEIPNKTIVRINSTEEPQVHKLKIKNEFPVLNDNYSQMYSDNNQGKTSIMINGDDCYCTVNVSDDISIYQSSVVVKDSGITVETPEKKSSTVYITGNFTTIENNNKKLVENKEIETVPPQKVEVKPVQAKEENQREEEKTRKEVKKTVEVRPKSDLSTAEMLQQLLSDPVEAVKRNLVPHVCGKSDVSRRPRSKKMVESNDLVASFLNDSLLNSSGHHQSDHVSQLIEESFSKLRIHDNFDDDKTSEHSSSTQYETMEGSDCYTDNSNRSSVTEEELSARSKFYELLAESAVEVEGDDHHYECIKVNNDPIYEEIEIPPPLPSNPPPSTLLDDLQLDKEYTTRSIFEGASKYDILSYLVDAKERGIIPEDSYTYNFNNSGIVVEEEGKETAEPYNRVSHMSTVSDSSEESSLVLSNEEKAQRSVEVERNDSGVGSETSKSSLSKYRTKQELTITCEDCDMPVENQGENEPLICRKCMKKRSERKEIISEIVETEEKYSRDLQIILEEFYQPMLVAGLLTSDQLSAIFLNVEELLENSQALAERLRDAVEIAVDQGDEDLLTVNIGKLILEAAPMLHAFETYCVRQGAASLLLASLEKEKELLRIFLRVSQMENTVLRRMNLNSFLMVPVQRVTKYPLLLARLYKVTSPHHETREQLKEAQHKIELHLNHMNSETKDVPSKLWRRISNSNGRRSSSEMDLVNIKLRKIAVDVLEWNHDEARFALEGKLLFTQPTDNNWRKGRTIKLTHVNALLVTNGKVSTSSSRPDPSEDGLIFSRHSGVREAALLLVRDKNGRYSLLREPLYLDRCVIAADPAWQSYFEVQELLGKDTFIFKADDDDQTKIWYKHLQYYAQGMGAWRKRRNALANIMINGMGLRS